MLFHITDVFEKGNFLRLSFIFQIFVELLLCIRNSSVNLGSIGEQNKGPCSHALCILVFLIFLVPS